MNDPQDARYTDQNQWVRMAGDVAVIGITFHGQSALGDIVTVELPPLGRVLVQGQGLALVESVKAVFEFGAPLSGVVVERNEKVVDAPGLINQDCYGAGWLFKVRPSNLAELDSLMTAEQYDFAVRNA